MDHSIDQKGSRGRAYSHQGRRRTVHVSSQEVGSWQQSSTSFPIGSECVGRAVSQSEVPPPKSRHAVLPPPLCPECKAVSMRSPHTKTCNKFPHDVLVDTEIGAPDDSYRYLCIPVPAYAGSHLDMYGTSYEPNWIHSPGLDFLLVI